MMSPDLGLPQQASKSQSTQLEETPGLRLFYVEIDEDQTLEKGLRAGWSGRSATHTSVWRRAGQWGSSLEEEGGHSGGPDGGLGDRRGGREA